MAANQKILIFCPPFSGHFNVIKDMINASKDSIEWKIVITGWTNVKIELGDLMKNSIVLADSLLNDTDPALWTFPRAVQLLDPCLKITTDFQPDLIIYDFFSLEGKFVGDLMNVPTWSSIPAFVGSFANKEYVENKLSSKENKQALAILSTKYGISVKSDTLEMISDGLHIPAELNLVWSYKSITPLDFMNGRREKPYVFVGSSKELLPNLPEHETNASPTIYLSFGTVVMNNLWNQQDELRQRLTSFIAILAKRWTGNPWNIVFTTQGKQILQHYPKNWTIKESADQVTALAKADVFITHGGSNSFHESLLMGTPVVVVPFFGDQPLLARSAQELGVGINLVPNAAIDTHASKSFLSDGLVDRMDKAVHTILNTPTYRNTIKAIDFQHDNVYDLIEGKITFQEGDLLFGTNVARKKYVDENDLQTEFTILEFKAFSELAPHKRSLPRIVDIYHDVILDEAYFNTDTQSDLLPYVKHLKEYKEYLAGETDFEKMCIKGLDFFSQYYKIHFILSDYDPELNPITKAEINHILNNEERLKSSVTFYKSVKGRWRIVNYDEVRIIQKRNG